jgi:hypothetical protein
MQIGMFVAFSHKLTKEQIEDAESSLGVTTFVYPSEDIQKKISNIPDDMDPREIRDLAWRIVDEAMEADCEYFFMAGQPELFQYCTARVLHGRYMTPVNSVTKRESVESMIDGKVVKTSSFVHVRWREII